MAMVYVLRDLPGVAELEARLQRIGAHPNPEWAPEVDGRDDHVDRVARQLFGITEDEIGLRFGVDENPGLLEHVASLGWDLNSATGGPLLAVEYLITPIMVAIDGSAGRLPDQPPSDEEIEQRSTDWETKIRAEAATFKPGGRGR
jgi:hypothetical protein